MCVVQCIPKLIVWVDPAVAALMFLVLAFVVLLDSPRYLI